MLRRLIGQKIYFCVQPEEVDLYPHNELSTIFTASDEDQINSPLMYEYGKPADYFILILEGRVRVVVGNERLTYESGPFTYFGVSALRPPEILGRSRQSESASIAGMPTNTQTLNDSTSNSISRPPSPESMPLLPSNNTTQTQTTSRPGSPDLSNLMHSPSASSEVLGLPPYASASQLPSSNAPVSNSSADRQSLTHVQSHTFVPDFWVQALTTTIYMKIPRKVYLAAVRASLLDRRDEFMDSELEQFREEVDSLIYSQLACKGSTSGALITLNPKIKKSSSEVLREKKLSLAGISPKLSTTGSILSSDVTSVNNVPLKRKTSGFPLSSPKSARKSLFGSAGFDSVVNNVARPNSSSKLKTTDSVVLELGARDSSSNKNT